jgi:hypothetical protein
MYSRFASLVAITAAGAVALGAAARGEESKPQDSAAVHLFPRPRLELLQPTTAPHPAASVPPASVTFRRGTLNLTIAMFNRSGRPAGAPLWCTAMIYGSSVMNFEGSDLPFYYAKATVTPAYAVCTITIPYRMRVRDPNGAALTLFASVSGSVASSALLDAYYDPLVPADPLNLFFPARELPLAADGGTISKTLVSVI